MTWMSHFRTATTSNTAVRSRSPLWPATCMLLCTGCFYVKPIKEPVVNVPPTIDHPIDAQQRVTVFADSVTLTVHARDIDSSEVTIDWPGLDQQTWTTRDQLKSGNKHVGVLEVRNPADWGVTNVVAHVHDDSNNLITVDFELVYP